MEFSWVETGRQVCFRVLYARLRGHRVTQSVLQRPAALLLACVLIFGCQGSDPEDGGLSLEGGALRITLPGTLRQLPEDGTLQAFYTVDAGTQVSMDFNDANQAIATVSVTPGEHTFRILFLFDDVQFGTVQLSEVERTLNVAEGTSTLNFSATDYAYPDTDMDTFSNLAEVTARTDPNDANSKPEPNKIFVTSALGTGDLSTWAAAGGNEGLAAADAVCQASAQAAGLPGTFKAWMSDALDDAYCRVHNLKGKKSNNCGQSELPVAAGPWVRTDSDSIPFGEGIAKILGDQGAVLSPVSYDEFGNLVSLSTVLTGTNRQGVWTGTSSCTNWTSASDDFNAVQGSAFSTTVNWTELGTSLACSSMFPIMCFQTGEGAPLPDFATGGKKVFFTSAKGNGNLNSWEAAGGMSGINAGDEICRVAARNASLDDAENFKAWLSDITSDAKDRLASDGPWVRIDGLKVADNKSALLTGILFNSISQNESGVYGSVRVWTGTNTDGTRNDDRCVDWTNGTNVFMGLDGSSSGTGQVWSQFSPLSACGGIRHLYCFED